MCLGAILTDEIKTDAITKAGDAMKEIQLIYQSLRKISVFLNNLNVTSFGYLPSEQCVQALLSQRCQQCQTNIPTLCEDICTSLVISCLSPLQDGIQSQIEAVWNVTRQLTLLTQQLMAEILRKHQPSILPPSALPTIVCLSYVIVSVVCVGFILLCMIAAPPYYKMLTVSNLLGFCLSCMSLKNNYAKFLPF